MAQENQIAKQPQQQLQKTQQSVGDLLHSPGITAKIQEVLGNSRVAAGFISSVISVASGSKQLRAANPMTVVGAAMVAATLQLPIVPTIGLAYIVPYKGQAQFQIGYKGLIELAERSGQFKNIIDEVVYDGQLVRKNRFTGEYVFDEDARKKVKNKKGEEVPTDKVIGYMARFDLINGFSKTIFWTIEEVQAHANKFSQSFRSGYESTWTTNFDAMARKTVLKALFSKYAPKSIELQNAIQYDQSVVRASEDISTTNADAIDIEAFDTEYIDNPDSDTDPSEEIAAAARQAATSAQGKAAAAMAAAINPGEAIDTETGEVKEVKPNK